MYQPPERKVEPRVVTIAVDATFFGKRRDRMGTLVFLDVLTNEIVAGKHIETETAEDYRFLLEQLLSQGFTVQGVVLDGKRGVAKVFGDIPVQMCQFHQLAIIKRKLTNKPKLEASRELLKIALRLSTTTQTWFTNALDAWYLRHQSFLGEKTLNPTNGKLGYTHERLVSAYSSLRNNLPSLFVYKNRKELGIPNTTNHLDGGVFSQLKKFIKLHQGLVKNRRVKFVDSMLDSYNKKE